MHVLGESFGQTVCQRLQDDCAIVVMRLLECLYPSVYAHTRGNRECPDGILYSGFLGSDEISQALVWTSSRFQGLLAQIVKSHREPSSSLIRVDFHVVIIYRVGGKKAKHGIGCQPLLLDDFFQHVLGVAVQIGGRFSHHLVLENCRKPAGQFPRLKKRRPVYERHQFFQWIVSQGPYADKIRFRRRVALPIGFKRILPGIRYG